METLYDLLGALPRDDADGLRAAFRRAVKGAHPDIHPGDPDAGLKFRMIVRASEILADGDQRAAYDHLLDLADQEQRQLAKRAVARRVRQVASGVIAFSVALGLIAGGYLAITQMPEEWVAPVTELAGVVRQSTEAAAATLRQSTEAAATVVRQSAETVTAAVKPVPLGQLSGELAPQPPARTQPAPPPETTDGFELPPQIMMPTAIALQPGLGDPPATTIGLPLDITAVDAKTYRERGIIAYRNGDLTGAIADFDQAIKLDPNRATTWAFRGLALLMQGKDAEAERDFARSLELDPDLKESLNARINEAKQHRAAIQ